jgi:purine-nucleoside phosphorylase
VNFIRTECPLKPKIGIILGSGMGSFAEQVTPAWSQEYARIPHFGSTTVEGHPGRMILGHLGSIPVALLQGRIHYYEGHSMAQVVFPTRVLAMLGTEALIVTNAAGGLSKRMRPGDFMIITDHLNLMGDNPLKGKNIDQWGPRFPDMTEAYDKRFIKLALKAAKKHKLRYSSGSYIGLTGPTYETPAEVRYLQKIGGNAVGMSTVPEVIAANHLGVRVCGLSCITNLAAGISAQKLNHEEVTQVTRMVADKFKSYLTELIEKMAEDLHGNHTEGR